MPREGALVSSPGLRRETVKKRVPPAKSRAERVTGLRPGRQTGGRRPRGTKPIRECWLTGKKGRKYFQEHHVMLRENDPDLTVWLSRGAHYLVNLLSRYKLINDTEKLEDLVMLARTQAGLENKRIVVRFEEVG